MPFEQISWRRLSHSTYGTAPKYAGKDYVNPSLLILSAEMTLRHLAWLEATDLIVKGIGFYWCEDSNMRFCSLDERRD